MERKLVVLAVAASLLFGGSVCNATIVYMDATTNNGSFTYGTGTGGLTAAGFWYNTPTAVPTGWTEVSTYMYTTGTRWIQIGSVAEAVNNTNLQVQVGHAFTASADLGGGDGTLAMVRVYATENADGTGNKVLLSSVERLGQVGDGYNLFNVVGTPGTPVSAALAGYYVQVGIGGPWSDFQRYLAGYVDNIVVTSQIPEPATLVLLTIGGLCLRKRK